MAGGKEGGEIASSEDGRRRLRWWVIGVALLAGVVAWVATQGGDNGSEASLEADTPRIVSVEELEEISASSGHPVYWIGSQEGKALEVNEEAGGNIQVSYVDEGAEAGGDRANLLTVGSYPLADAEGDLEGFAAREGSIVRRADDGRRVVTSVENPSSVYFASPDGSVQVEVYDPSPQRAMRLALSGRVQPIG